MSECAPIAWEPPSYLRGAGTRPALCLEPGLQSTSKGATTFGPKTRARVPVVLALIWAIEATRRRLRVSNAEFGAASGCDLQRCRDHLADLDQSGSRSSPGVSIITASAEPSHDFGPAAADTFDSPAVDTPMGKPPNAPNVDL